MTDTLLLIHHDVNHLRDLGGRFERLGYEVVRELDPAAGLAAYDRLRPDVVVVNLPTTDGETEEALSHLVQRQASVVMLLDDAGQTDAERWAQIGVYQTLPCDVPDDPLARAVARASGNAKSLRRLVSLHREGAVGGLKQLGNSVRMREVAQQITALAQSDRATVFLTGPLGVGKGWCARLIHDLGPRMDGPFVEMPLAGPAVDLDAHLFGVEAGAIGGGGARERRRGMFEVADGGTLYLRDVDQLPPELQPKLLRALETRTFRRVGGTRDLTADTRIIAGTQTDLAAVVEADGFRGDLYYRLSVVQLGIPSLAERDEGDRLGLVSALHAEIRRRIPGAPPAIAVETLERLLGYPWPGNVLEMRNVLERASILAVGLQALGVEHLPGEFRARPGLGDRRHTPMSLAELDQGHIERTLQFHGGNRTRAAKELGISRATLINKIKRYQLTE